MPTDKNLFESVDSEQERSRTELKNNLKSTHLSVKMLWLEELRNKKRIFTLTVAIHNTKRYNKTDNECLFFHIFYFSIIQILLR